MHICTMDVFQVMCTDNKAVAARPAYDLLHGEMEINKDNNTVNWIAVECDNEQMAIEVADKVIKMMWVKEVE